MQSIFILATVSHLLFLFSAVGKVETRIEPTKFQHGKIYALENQQAGKYLTSGGNGQFSRTGDHGTPSLDQRWRFVAAKDAKGIEGWQLVPLNGDQPQPTVWTQIYVGHGKFQFRSTTSLMCLEASSRGVEVRCVTEDLFQRWFPHPLTE